MTSHDACTSRTSQVLTVAPLQRLKMEALIPAPGDCVVLSVIKLLNVQSIAPIEIVSCANSNFPLFSRSLLPKFVRKLCAKWAPKQLAPEHKAKCKGSALTIVVLLFLHIKKSFSANVSVLRMTERRRWLSHSGSFQFHAAEFYDTRVQSWSHDIMSQLRRWISWKWLNTCCIRSNKSFH